MTVDITLTDAEVGLAANFDGTPLEFWTCCDRKRVVDLTSRGKTCGGLDTIGGLTCTVCGSSVIAKGVTREASSADVDTAWSLAGGGRSVNCGGTRIRADGKAKNVEQLMARIVQLPQLEAEIERLRKEIADCHAANGSHEAA